MTYFLLIFFLITALFFNCPVDQTKDGDNGGGATPVDYNEMVPITGKTYIQRDTNNNTFDHSISSFQMAKYEVTYELWYTVHNWALSNGYFFANPGREGHDGIITDPEGAAPTTAKYEPVTTINWRDTIVWCNAYSEMAGLTPVYYSDLTFTTIIKDSQNSNASQCDDASPDWTANGYRLPTEGEWQFVASNKGGTPYNYASGATDDYNNATETQKVAWYSANSGSSTKAVGTTANSSALMLWDISGNVYEWCWDWYSAYPGASTDYRGPASGSERIRRGGSWFNTANCLQVGGRYTGGPSDVDGNFGFRVARTN